MKTLLLLLFLTIILSCATNSINSKTAEPIWGPLMEDWITGYKSNRENRVMKLPDADNAYVIDGRVSRPQSTKLINQSVNKPAAERQITETDLYLLTAIEKLVYRADFMEKRLRKVEEMLYFVMAGSRVDHEPCPENFTRAGNQCYYFSDRAGREKDWKNAARLCQKKGAVLAEMETIEESQDIVSHIQANGLLRGKEFWTGGLNPGLLWIWSNSARPVTTDKTHAANNTAKIQGDGRCLRLGYDPAHRSYAYRGSDCSARYQYICEFSDKSTSNQISKLAQERHLDL